MQVKAAVAHRAGAPALAAAERMVARGWDLLLRPMLRHNRRHG